MLLCIYLMAAQTLAQAPLQNTGGAPLQQRGQARPTNNSQVQTGTPQANNGQSVLNQRSTQPLGVVSDPTQTTPEAVANPSQTLQTNVTPEKISSSTLPVSLVLGFLAVLAGAAIIVGWLYGRRQADEETAFEEENAFAHEPSRAFKKQKRPKKKRKKPHQR